VALRRAALWPAAAVLGVAAESVAFDWSDPRHWLPDLATGWVLIACGLVAWDRRPDSQAGLLMTATGFAWFAPNFAAVEAAWIAWLAAHALFLHRGPLVQLVVTYPRGRIDGRLDAAVVASGYAAAVITPVWRSEGATIALAGLLVAASGWSYVHAVGRRRRDRLASLRATGLLAAMLAVTASLRLGIATPEMQARTLLAYEATLVVLAAALLVGLLRPRSAIVTDLVVDVGSSRSGTLRDALARELGDPTLELGYWVAATSTYADASGRALAPPAPGSGRAETRIDLDGRPVALLVHDPAVLNDSGLVDAVAAATRLAARNADLQAEVRKQVSEVTASRLRLLRARDDERRRLERLLHEGAELRLTELGVVLESARRRTGSDARLDEVERQLDRTLSDLRELAAGLHPRELTELGLAGALGELARRSPVPVELIVSLEPLQPDIEAAVYFTCSETLANVAKYASASRVDLSVSAGEGSVVVDVRDDGVGGADPSSGTGLSGLADRVGALGGSLLVESPPGGGTHVVAELPAAGLPV